MNKELKDSLKNFNDFGVEELVRFIKFPAKELKITKIPINHVCNEGGATCKFGEDGFKIQVSKLKPSGGFDLSFIHETFIVKNSSIKVCAYHKKCTSKKPCVCEVLSCDHEKCAHLNLQDAKYILILLCILSIQDHGIPAGVNSILAKEFEKKLSEEDGEEESESDAEAQVDMSIDSAISIKPKFELIHTPVFMILCSPHIKFFGRKSNNEFEIVFPQNYFSFSNNLELEYDSQLRKDGKNFFEPISKAVEFDIDGEKRVCAIDFGPSKAIVHSFGKIAQKGSIKATTDITFEDNAEYFYSCIIGVRYFDYKDQVYNQRNGPEQVVSTILKLWRFEKLLVNLSGTNMLRFEGVFKPCIMSETFSDPHYPFYVDTEEKVLAQHKKNATFYYIGDDRNAKDAVYQINHFFKCKHEQDKNFFPRIPEVGIFKEYSFNPSSSGNRLETFEWAVAIPRPIKFIKNKQPVPFPLILKPNGLIPAVLEIFTSELKNTGLIDMAPLLKSVFFVYDLDLVREYYTGCKDRPWGREWEQYLMTGLSCLLIFDVCEIGAEAALVFFREVALKFRFNSKIIFTKNTIHCPERLLNVDEYSKNVELMNEILYGKYKRLQI